MKKKAILVMDAFRGHLHESVRKQLEIVNTDIAVIPGGLTGILQPLDVGINKPFKDRVRQKWVNWLQSDDHSFTPAGNLKKPTLPTVGTWIKESWDDIPPEIIVRSFLKCSISNALDGAEDDVLFDSETDGESSASDASHVSELDVHYDDLAAMFADTDNSDEEFIGFESEHEDNDALAAIFAESDDSGEFLGFFE